ncbi:MAG TPA: hypothetical protein PKY30_10470, partial [Myxococcota bacterium]|nr:hypothetical protein [Myxococcota bacterium]
MDYDPTHWGLTKLVFANGGGTDLTYGPDQTRLATMIHAVPGALGKLWKYTYDALGQLGGDGEDTYAYDALGRLTSVAARDP